MTKNMTRKIDKEDDKEDVKGGEKKDSKEYKMRTGDMTIILTRNVRR